MDIFRLNYSCSFVVFIYWFCFCAGTRPEARVRRKKRNRFLSKINCQGHINKPRTASPRQFPFNRLRLIVWDYSNGGRRWPNSAIQSVNECLNVNRARRCCCSTRCHPCCGRTILSTGRLTRCGARSTDRLRSIWCCLVSQCSIHFVFINIFLRINYSIFVRYARIKINFVESGEWMRDLINRKRNMFARYVQIEFFFRVVATMKTEKWNR